MSERKRDPCVLLRRNRWRRFYSRLHWTIRRSWIWSGDLVGEGYMRHHRRRWYRDRKTNLSGKHQLWRHLQRVWRDRWIPRYRHLRYICRWLRICGFFWFYSFQFLCFHIRFCRSCCNLRHKINKNRHRYRNRWHILQNKRHSRGLLRSRKIQQHSLSFFLRYLHHRSNIHQRLRHKRHRRILLNINIRFRDKHRWMNTNLDRRLIFYRIRRWILDISCNRTNLLGPRYISSYNNILS